MPKLEMKMMGVFETFLSRGNGHKLTILCMADVLSKNPDDMIVHLAVYSPTGERALTLIETDYSMNFILAAWNAITGQNLNADDVDRLLNENFEK